MREFWNLSDIFVLLFAFRSVNPTLWQDLRYRADEFRLWLVTSCCSCLASVPSFALVIAAMVLIMLLLATIPLAFALAYSSSESSGLTDDQQGEESGNGIDGVRFFKFKI